MRVVHIPASRTGGTNPGLLVVEAIDVVAERRDTGVVPLDIGLLPLERIVQFDPRADELVVVIKRPTVTLIKLEPRAQRRDGD